MKAHNRTQSDFFNDKTEINEEAALSTKELPFYVKKEMESFFAFAGLNEPLDVLSVASGWGPYTVPLLRKGCRVTATDISERSLAILKKRADQEGLSEGLFIDKNSFEDEGSVKKYLGMFDRVICIGGVHHFNPEKRDTIIMNMSRALKKGGYMTLLEPNPLNPFYYLGFLYSWIARKHNIRWHVDKNFVHSNARNLKKVLGKCGLSGIEVKRYALLPSILARNCGCVLGFNDFLLKVPAVRAMSAFVWVKGKK